MKPKSKLKRSLAKSVTFRMLVVSSDFIVVYFLTHRIDFAIGTIIMTNMASTLLYFIHERMWSGVLWGKA